MSDDIVRRLQNECQCSDDCRAVNDPCIPMQGASEIERLRAELKDADDDFHALKAMFDRMRAEVRGE